MADSEVDGSAREATRARRAQDEVRPPPPSAALPARPVERLTRPIARFLHQQALGGVVLLLATAVALVLANSELGGAWDELWATRLVLRVGTFELDHTLSEWIDDGLMTVFFFVIGLELKRELVWGELTRPRQIVLPAAAALGGALVPVLVFLASPGRAEAADAWPVPMATDIAFVVGCLALLGPRVPGGLKVFVLTLAIVDDLLAVLVIALVLTESLGIAWLLGALAGFLLLALLRWAGVRRVSVYMLVGTAIWLCTLESGVHPTVAGVLLGLATPVSAFLAGPRLAEVAERAVPRLEGADDPAPDPERRRAASGLSFAAKESISVAERLEHALHPWVGFAILPLFALANAGIAVRTETLLEPVALSVAAALVVGKPLGILAASFLAVRSGLADLPAGVDWRTLLGAGQLAGIGFTMALFLASLGLEGEALLAAKSGVLLGSALSLVLGLTLLALRLRSR